VSLSEVERWAETHATRAAHVLVDADVSQGLDEFGADGLRLNVESEACSHTTNVVNPLGVVFAELIEACSELCSSLCGVLKESITLNHHVLVGGK